jgi:transposase
MFNEPKKYKLKSKNEKSGSVYFGIVSRRHHPDKFKTALKKWQHLAGITGSISSEWVAGFAPDYPPMELKLILIDNAGFHSLKQYDIPENIVLIRIPPYTPELNPSEKIWHYIKQYYKNNVFETLDNVKQWLHDFIKTKLSQELVKSITHNEYYLNTYKAHFNV